MKDTLPDRVRLGDFEIDLRAGEVCSGDRSVLLQEKSLRVLQILLEYRRELVTREEIQRRLWPNDTIVDFENGINTAVKRLRQALVDPADEPKYIETIPRRGYRLLVTMEWLDAQDSSAGLADDRDSSIAHPRTTGLLGKKVSHYRILDVLGGGGMGMLYKAEDLKLGRQVALKFLPEELASDSLALQRFEREARTASSLNHPNICTIYEVEDYEGQPFIVMELLEGETLRDRLATSMSEDRRVPHPSREGERGPMVLDKLLEIAIQVAAGLGAAHAKGIIHRDIKPANIFLTSAGQVKILDFGLAKLVGVPDVDRVERAFRPASGAVPLKLSSRAQRVAAATSEVEGPAVSSPDHTADPSTAYRPDPQNKRVGEERRHSAQDDRVKVADPTLTRTGLAMGTAGYMSPEQIRGEKLDARTDIFSFGLVLYEMAAGQRAFTGKTAAVVHDVILNTSPPPLRELNSTLPVKLVSAIDKALEKDRERLSQRTRWFVEAVYYHIMGDLARTNATYEQWLRTFPADPYPHENFAVSLAALGQHEKATEEFREGVRLTPGAQSYNGLMASLIWMDRLEEAKTVFDEARARGINDLYVREKRYDVAFFQHDSAGMQEQLSWAMARPETKEWALQQQGNTAIYYGRFRAALRFYSKTPSYSPTSAVFLIDSALRDAETGNLVRAKRASDRALAANPPSAVRRKLALISARAGAVDQAAKLVEAIDQESPLDTVVQKHELPSIRAAIELDKGRPAQAIELLKSALPYDLAVSLDSFPPLYSAYLRGLAYLKLGDGPEAAGEFQKMIDHPGIVGDFITAPLSCLQLARAQVMLGDKAAARKSYQDFLTLWKDADADIPVYRQAKAEYAKLR